MEISENYSHSVENLQNKFLVLEQKVDSFFVKSNSSLEQVKSTFDVCFGILAKDLGNRLWSRKRAEVGESADFGWIRGKCNENGGWNQGFIE